jgi:transcriptional regulator with XRE-family HTH domain
MDLQTQTAATTSPDVEASARPSVALGKAIRRARADRYTLAQLSARSGVSAGLLSLIERGRGNPSINTLGAIAGALGVSLPELVADAIDTQGGPEALVATLQPVAGTVVETSAPTGDWRDGTDEQDRSGRAWRSSMVLRGGEEAHVRVLDGTLELTLHDRTADLSEGPGPLSVDLRLWGSAVGAADSGALAIPPAEDPRWLEFARGDIPFEPTTLACQMLFTHVVRCVRQDPSSPNVERWVRELRGFFVKYEAVSAAELTQIFG